MKCFIVPEVRTAALSSVEFWVNIFSGLVFPEAENRYAPMTQTLSMPEDTLTRTMQDYGPLSRHSRDSW